jgi:hypothetical protein
VSAKKLPLALRDWAAYRDCRRTIDDFLELLPLFQSLSHKSVRPRWVAGRGSLGRLLRACRGWVLWLVGGWVVGDVGVGGSDVCLGRLGGGEQVLCACCTGREHLREGGTSGGGQGACPVGGGAGKNTRQPPTTPPPARAPPCPRGAGTGPSCSPSPARSSRWRRTCSSCGTCWTPGCWRTGGGASGRGGGG